MKISSLVFIMPLLLPCESKITAQSISASNDWSIVLCSDGTVQTYGRNDHGQLGNGTFMESPTPVAVSNLSNIIAVSAGLDHAIALTAEGKVWGWGDNIHGQLGNGSFVDITTPVEVDSLENVVAISAGANHSMAITDDGKMWVWGSNNKGQLGVADISNSPLPLEVTSLSNVTKISGAANHTIASTEDGQAWAWGHNLTGQLGNGTNEDTHIPQLLDIPAPIIDVGAGNAFSYCLTENGDVWACGANFSGQLGNGTGDDSNVPVQVIIDNVKYMAQGPMAGLCIVLKHDNSAWAWGSNVYGAFGNGQVGNQLEPVAVPNFNDAHEISVGSDHSMALFSDETAHVAGLNGWGQLGLGTFNSAETAVVNELVCAGFVSIEGSDFGELLIYPNPSDGRFSIQHHELFDKVEILDVTGKLVYEKGISPTYTWNLSIKVPPGMYIVQIRSTQYVINKRLIMR